MGPGRTRAARFTDIRDIQRTLWEAGIECEVAAEDSGTGPASFIILDPDGNPIIVDQHIWPVPQACGGVANWVHGH